MQRDVLSPASAAVGFSLVTNKINVFSRAWLRSPGRCVMAQAEIGSTCLTRAGLELERTEVTVWAPKAAASLEQPEPGTVGQGRELLGVPAGLLNAPMQQCWGLAGDQAYQIGLAALPETTSSPVFEIIGLSDESKWVEVMGLGFCKTPNSV